MELEATGPSVPSVILDEDGNMIDSRLPSGEPLQFVFEKITWQQELSWEEAARRLEVAMYPFKKVRPDGGEGRGWDPWGWVRSCGSSRWALGVGCRAGLAAEAVGPSLGRGASPLPFRTWRRHPLAQHHPFTQTNTHCKHTCICTHTRIYTTDTHYMHITHSAPEWDPGGTQ